MFFETIERIRSVGRRHRGKSYTPESFIHLLRCQFRDRILKFHCFRDKKIKSGHWTINGCYDIVDDQDDKPCIHINFTFPIRAGKRKIDTTDWDVWAFNIADVVTHEYLHRYYVHQRGMQFGRGYRTRHMGEYERTMQDYLGCEDEILAYGFTCAAEQLFYNRAFEKTRTYRLYRKHFARDLNVLVKLKKSTSKYIKILESYNEQDGYRVVPRNRRSV